MAKNENTNGTTPWEAELVQRFGAAAREHRGKRSARWLSERTKTLGYPISPTVIAKLDSGHRGSTLQLAEVFVIAEALDVSPIQLLFPGMPHATYEVVPGLTTTAIAAFGWFTGSRPLPPRDEDASLTEISEHAAAWHRTNQPVRLTRDLLDVLYEGAGDHRRAEAARDEGQNGVAEYFQERAETSFKRREEILRQMYDLGMPLQDSIRERFERDDAPAIDDGFLGE